ncbi:MAG: hypothetical protein ONB48_05695 [candidate division KSB1 bacterium]|nr:hypothetical protein [candidate division KSB1 bacterium]MDZ7273041.1 hypothetical protein [candidate division KSB1 bacterium]MDZ7285144.1 hypothetical protein [candidate division KSB1 bacterium]MDZ7298176.1 hypothetical protein [candidate division KSB1 bacterium]MDZ7307842.1 hypothetical protein [candidate division KSB1 bacterium]
MSPAIEPVLPQHVLAAVRDLFLRSKIQAVARAAAVEVEIHGDFSTLLARLPEQSAVLLVNLEELPATALPALSASRAAGHRVIGFLSHVEVDLARAARAAGCLVMARSQFFARLPEILTGRFPAGAPVVP